MNARACLAGIAALVAPLTLAAQTSDSGTAITVSGYVTSSYFMATKPTDRTIVGRLFDRFNDEAVINAARLTFERVAATDRVDAGLRIDALFGQDATLTHSAGLALGSQGDLPQAFVTLNIPTGGGNYLQFKAGKRWAMLDVEVLDDVLNPNFSKGYEFVYLTNGTDTGASLYAKLSSKVDAEIRMINGWDLVEDNNTWKSAMGRVGVTPSDRVGLAVLGYWGPEQTANVHDMRYGGEFVGTFKPASSATIYAQFDAGTEEGIGAAGGNAHWWGAGLWGVFDLHAKVSLALRADYMDDHDGVRTSGVLGFDPAPSRKIGGGTFTLNVKSWPHALVRPEIRVEHSSLDDFGNVGGRSSTQVTAGLALSYIF